VSDQRHPTRVRLSELRRRAERAAQSSNDGQHLTHLPSDEARRIIHELDVHRIELTMQNEELERAVVELETARNRYADLYDYAPVGYLTLGRDGRILQTNLTGARLLDSEPRALIGKRLADFVDAGDADAFYLHQRSVCHKAEPSSCELRFAKFDGSCWVAQLDSVPPSLPEDQPGGCRTTIYDITARRHAEQELQRHREHLEEIVQERTQALSQAQEQLRQAERLTAIGTLAAGIAHEINNPIGSILLHAQTALRNRASPHDPQLEKTLNTIVGEARRCGRIVRGMLAFARQGTTERVSSELQQVIQSAVDLTKTYVANHGIAMSVEHSVELPPISLCPTEIVQVLVNIIRNAVEACDRGGQISIRTARAPIMVEMTIHDTGRGIPAEQIDHIFDPFYTMGKRGSGTGLGLSISHGIVTRHGGSIAVQSTPGEGTTFHIHLPIAIETGES